MSPSGDTAVVIPAREESDRIGGTVRAAIGLPGVDLVLVVDDGSRDQTRALAERAGAAVVSHPRPRGKGAAMETGAEAVRLLDRREGRVVPRHGPAAGRGPAVRRLPAVGRSPRRDTAAPGHSRRARALPTSANCRARCS